jgi:hypothetical protein
MFVCVLIKPASCGQTVNFPQFRGRPVKPQLPAPSLLEKTMSDRSHRANWRASPPHRGGDAKRLRHLPPGTHISTQGSRMKLSTFTYSDTDRATMPSIPPKHPDRTLVIMFGPSHLLDAPAPVQSVLAAYPGAAAIGCSSSGEIFGTHIQDDTLVVALIQFDHTTVRTASAPVTDPGQSFEAAQALANQLMSTRTTRGPGAVGRAGSEWE